MAGLFCSLPTYQQLRIIELIPFLPRLDGYYF